MDASNIAADWQTGAISAADASKRLRELQDPLAQFKASPFYSAKDKKPGANAPSAAPAAANWNAPPAPLSTLSQQPPGVLSAPGVNRTPPTVNDGWKIERMK